MRNATPIRRTGLPAPGDLFVGRDTELAAVCGMLKDARARLVTLTGPPGIGKTRLAVACAAAYADMTACDALFLDLAPVREPAQVIVELARALGVDPADGADAISELTIAAGGEDRLVVLDNFEHLLEAANDLGEVLAACPRLAFLVTSRERLRLSAEQEFPVSPLAMPSRDDATDPESLAMNPSVALLVDRARRTSPDFAVTSANALLLASACIRLEGLPLAIELAGARLKLLTPGELVFRLASRMDVLAGSTRDVPVRQRTLRNAIEWSYELLGPQERALFRRLSVFAGSWSLADAGSVCAETADGVLPIVESLLDKSLIRRQAAAVQAAGVQADGEQADGVEAAGEQAAEFFMLESLREYAAQQLAAHGEAEHMRASHAAYYAALAVQFEASVGQPAERWWFSRIDRYDTDMRTALDYCLTAAQHAGALSLTTALGLYHYSRGDLGQGQELMDRVLSSDAARHVRERPDGDDGAAALSGAMIMAGCLASARGQPDRAHDLLSRALADSEERGDLRHAALAAAFLGHVARGRGQWDESERWHRRAAARFEQLANAPGVAWAQYDLGLLARDRGDHGSAATLLRASLRHFRDLSYPWATGWSAWGLGAALSAQGEVDEARLLLGEALEIFRDFDDRRGVAHCLEALAEIASELAQYETAARLIGAAEAHRARLAAPRPDADQERLSSVERTLARSLGPDAAERLRQAGRATSATQAAELGAAVALGTAPADPERARPVPLTRRERQVAALVASGRTNRQIGRALAISEKTAEVHLQHVMAKLDVRSRAEVAAWAAMHQLSAQAGQ